MLDSKSLLCTKGCSFVPPHFSDEENEVQK